MDSLKTKVTNNKWVIAGAVLGVLYGITGIIDRTPSFLKLFPQFGVFGEILHVIIFGWIGTGITRKCPPTRKALIGAGVFPFVLVIFIFLIGPSGFDLSLASLSGADLLNTILLGILTGILVGTFWKAALVGAGIAAIFTLFNIPFVRRDGALALGLIPMGAISGTILQLAFNDLKGKRTIKRKV